MATSNGEVTGVVETTVQVTGDVNPARGTISTGDMLKEVYDTNDDGIVNAADEAATLTDLTATVEELNYSSGLTGNIQDQLDGKADNDDIPTDLADLQDDADHRTVTDAEKTEWSDKSDFSGSYNDLTDKPVIPDAQIQSDWNQSDNTKADFIKNKPTIPAEQVNSDWNASSGKAEILNKPTIPTALSDLSDDSSHRTVTDAEKTTWNSGEANVQSDWNETDTSSDAYIQNKPTIPSVTANPGSTTATLSSIGIDGTNYAISGGGGGGAVDSVNGKTGVVLLDAEDVGALPDDTPLFSGDYEDLTNKPTIPNDLADLNDDSTHRLVTDTEKTTWNGKSDFSGSYNDLSNKPTLGSASALDVASSGDASTTQVVKGDDSRLSDARTPVSHTHTTSDITDFPTMSDYIQKSNTSGLVKNDGTIDTNSYATTSQIPDISGKADKVTSATNGNLAGLDANGNLTDSGWNGAKDTTSISGNPISISGLKSNQLAVNPIVTFSSAVSSVTLKAANGSNPSAQDYTVSTDISESLGESASGTWNVRTGVFTKSDTTTIQLTPHEVILAEGDNYVSSNGTSIRVSYHNGEIASLADVSQLGKTVNELGVLKYTDITITNYASNSQPQPFPYYRDINYPEEILYSRYGKNSIVSINIIGGSGFEGVAHRSNNSIYAFLRTEPSISNPAIIRIWYLI